MRQTRDISFCLRFYCTSEMHLMKTISCRKRLCFLVSLCYVISMSVSITWFLVVGADHPTVCVSGCIAKLWRIHLFCIGLVSFWNQCLYKGFVLLLLLLSVWLPTHGVIHNVAILWDTLFHLISVTLYVPTALGTFPPLIPLPMILAILFQGHCDDWN